MTAVRRPPVESAVRLLRRLESLDEHRAARLMRDELRADVAQARSSVPVLRRWEGVPPRNYDVYLEDRTQVRFRHLLDLLTPDDRILDIGVGYGFLTGVILRALEPEAYCGVDLKEHLLASARQMMEVNGIDGSRVTLELRNVYDVDPSFVRCHQPTVATMFEMLEHLPDAETALATVAAALDDDVPILFTVPLVGRLEHVWGHLSVFDVDRIIAMCDRVGVTIHHLEPIHNTWVLVGVTRSPEPHPRFPSDSSARGDDPSFRHVDLDGPSGGETKAIGSAEIAGAEESRRGLDVSIAPGERGGLSVPVEGCGVIRVELSGGDGIAEHLAVELRDRDRRCLARWEWRDDRLPDHPRTFVLRPGRDHKSFLADRAAPGMPIEVVITAATPRESGATFTIHRMAVMEGPVELADVLVGTGGRSVWSRRRGRGWRNVVADALPAHTRAGRLARGVYRVGRSMARR